MIGVSNFTVKGIFYNVKAVLTVDCDHKTAEIMMMVDNKIHAMSDVKFYEVDTVEKAKAWLNKDAGELGTFLERYYALHGRTFNNGIMTH